ncbi:hypothetical protein ACQ4PT_047728 [Festuca glaucescens]
MAMDRLNHSPSPEEEDDPLEQGGGDDGTAWRQGQGQGEAGLRLQACSILGAPATRGCAAKGSTNRGSSIRHAAPAHSTCADGDDGDGNQAKGCAGFCAAADESSASHLSPSSDDDDDGQEGADLQLTLTLRIFRRWAQRRAPHVLLYLELVQHQPSKRDDDKSRSSDDQEEVVERYAIHPRDEEYHTTPEIIATEEDQQKEVGFAIDVDEHDDSLKGEQVNIVGTFSDAAALSSAKNLGQDTDKVVEQQGAKRDDHTNAARDDKSNGPARDLQPIAQEHSVKDHKVAHHNTIQGMPISTDDIAVQDQKKVVEDCDVQLRAARDDNLRSASDDREVMEHYAIYPRDETTCDIAAEDKEKVGSAENVDALDRLGDIAVEEHDYLKEQVIVSNRVTFGDATALEDQTSGNQGAAKSGSTTEKYKDVVECFEWGVLNDLPIDRIVSQLINRASTTEEPIEITITENIEVEVIGDQIESCTFRGKMMVQFPQEVDRRVHFVVDKLGELDFTAHPRADRDFFKKFPVLTSERFLEGSYQLLKWHKENGRVPVPLEVSVDVKEDPYTKEHNKDVTKYFLVTLVVSNVDGHDVHFHQDAVGRYNFIIHHHLELVRRAAEAAEAQLAWELDWEDEGIGAWEDGDMNADEDNFA